MMRISHAWIQSHPHGVILRHILNTVISFLCPSANYLENRLLPNDLIIIRNHVDDEEDVRDTKNVHNKVEIQINLELQSLTSNPTRSSIPTCLQIDVHDAYNL
jgi:hypothetical protein